MSSYSEDLLLLSEPSYVASNPFEALACISAYFNNGNCEEGRELLYHVMDLGVLPPEYKQILTALVENAGVYPYLEPDILLRLLT